MRALFVAAGLILLGASAAASDRSAFFMRLSITCENSAREPRKWKLAVSCTFTLSPACLPFSACPMGLASLILPFRMSTS